MGRVLHFVGDTRRGMIARGHGLPQKGRAAAGHKVNRRGNMARLGRLVG